jgi:thymidylate synthase
MGMSNIKFLVDNDVHIWDDYPYKLYKEKIAKKLVPDITKEEFIEKIKKSKSYAKKYGELPHIYGEMWRKWPGHGRTVDQVKWAITEMMEDPDAHNLVVNSWNPEYLYRMAKPEEACRFPICHNMYQLNVKNGKVSLHLYQRSADIFLGVPFNIASYALLTLIFARLTGNEPGEFIHTFGDVHIYENHFAQAKEQLKRKPKKFPTVTISTKVKKLEDLLPEHITLENYNPHPTIKAELTVAGGYFVKDKKPASRKK